MSARDGGQAFPQTKLVENERGVMYPEIIPGISMRDYFAAKAMQGIFSDPEFHGTPEKLAEYAYQVADAMMQERVW